MGVSEEEKKFLSSQSESEKREMKKLEKEYENS